MVLINIALTSSMNIGMHRPSFEDEYTKVKITIRQLDLLGKDKDLGRLYAFGTEVEKDASPGRLSVANLS